MGEKSQLPEKFDLHTRKWEEKNRTLRNKKEKKKIKK